MQFTIVPNFQLPPVKGQEYIFLIDRSSSMSGARIETAKRFVDTLDVLKQSMTIILVLWNYCFECYQVANRNSTSSLLTRTIAVYGPTARSTTRAR
jgi:hypothetical protein